MPNPDPIRPVPYRGRTEHMLHRREYLLQDKVDKIVIMCGQRNQKLNHSKAKTTKGL